MLEELKRQVCDANLDLVVHGLVTLTWGNVSGLSDDRSILVIKPSGVPYDQLRPEQMVAIDTKSGKVVEGALKPSTDAPTHRLLYQNLSGIGGITDTHSPRATAFAQAGCEIPCFGTTHADHFYGPVPTTRPMTPREVASDYEENTAWIIVERFIGLDPLALPAVLVAGHAPFTWGKSAAESVRNAVALEAIAGMALDSLALAPRLQAIEPFLLDKHFLRKHGSEAYYGQ